MTRRRTKYRCRRVFEYEGAYDASRNGRHVAEVDRNGPNDFVAETPDGHRGYGRTRDQAVDAALAAD